jgi:thiamine transporter ThiT
MVVIILVIMFGFDRETGITTGVICCGIYTFIVGNNYRTLRLQEQEQCQQ